MNFVLRLKFVIICYTATENEYSSSFLSLLSIHPLGHLGTQPAWHVILFLCSWHGGWLRVGHVTQLGNQHPFL
jgi:hypothetical protein